MRVYRKSKDKDTYIFREDHLTLSTIATAKGYDAPVVFLAGVDCFETTERDRALFYVGATRAKHVLYVSGRTLRGPQGKLLSEVAVADFMLDNSPSTGASSINILTVISPGATSGKDKNSRIKLSSHIR